MKPTLIAFEGIDKVGKTAIRECVRKDLKFGPLPMDRFLASNFAYDCYYNRKHYIQNYKEMEELLLKSFDIVLVYLTCREEELVARLKVENSGTGAFINKKVMNHVIIPDIYFAAYFYYSQFRKIIIDTSDFEVEYTAEIVKRFVRSDSFVSTEYMSGEWKGRIKKDSDNFLKLDTLSIFNGAEAVFKGTLDCDNLLRFV